MVREASDLLEGHEPVDAEIGVCLELLAAGLRRTDDQGTLRVQRVEQLVVGNGLILQDAGDGEEDAAAPSFASFRARSSLRKRSACHRTSFTCAS